MFIKIIFGYIYIIFGYDIYCKEKNSDVNGEKTIPFRSKGVVKIERVGKRIVFASSTDRYLTRVTLKVWINDL